MQNGVVKDDLDKNELYYYGIADNSNTELLYHPNLGSKASANNVNTTAQLLQHKDGKCSAWSEFLRDIATAQGLKVGITAVLPQKDGYPVFMMPVGAGLHHGVQPLSRAWTNHIIVKYGNHYYDPSYGTYLGESEDAKRTMARSFEAYGVWEETPGEIQSARFVQMIAGNQAEADWVSFHD